MDAEAHSLLDDADFVGIDDHPAEFRLDQQRTLLGYFKIILSIKTFSIFRCGGCTNEEVSVGILHRFVVHGSVARVNVNGQAVAARRVTCSAQGAQSLDEIHGRIVLTGNIERFPPHLNNFFFKNFKIPAV